MVSKARAVPAQRRPGLSPEPLRENSCSGPGAGCRTFRCMGEGGRWALTIGLQGGDHCEETGLWYLNNWSLLACVFETCGNICLPLLGLFPWLIVEPVSQRLDYPSNPT